MTNNDNKFWQLYFDRPHRSSSGYKDTLHKHEKYILRKRSMMCQACQKI